MVFQGAVQKGRWDKIHDEREPLLQPDPGVERGRGRGSARGARKGKQARVDGDDEKLGPVLANLRGLDGTVSFVSSYHRRSSEVHLLARHAAGLAVRTNLPGQEFQILASSFQLCLQIVALALALDLSN